MGIRSFLAFELPKEMKATVSAVSRECRSLFKAVRWVDPAKIHLTVVFLGNIAEDQIDPLGHSVAAVCREHAPFQIALRGVGYFGSRRHPRVLWMGLNGDIDRMEIFRNALQETLRPFGIKTENRPFRPHLTLGRFKKGGRPGTALDEFIGRYRELTSPAEKLEELGLFKSQLKPGGAIYTRLGAWPLVGSG